jgi:tetratricopeptide (TPR) repeat protein
VIEARSGLQSVMPALNKEIIFQLQVCLKASAVPLIGSAEEANAVRLQPSSALAYSAQGWVLHHNLIGVDYGRGFDYEASLASYRKAVELDPNELDLRQSLAELLEYDKIGIRYAPGSHLAESIEIYRYIRAQQPSPSAEVEENFIIECF